MSTKTVTVVEGNTTKTHVTTYIPAETMRSFLKKHPGLAALMYIFPFFLTLLAWAFGLPRNVALGAAISSTLLMAAGLGADWPAAVNGVVAGMPVIVFAAYVALAKLSK